MEGDKLPVLETAGSMFIVLGWRRNTKRNTGETLVEKMQDFRVRYHNHRLREECHNA
jgi:hypothetical protein